MRSMYTYIYTHVYMYVCLRVCIYIFMLKTKAQDMAPGDLEAATRALHKLHGGEVLMSHHHTYHVTSSYIPCHISRFTSCMGARY